MNAGIERQIKQIYAEVFKKIYSASALALLSKGSRIQILQNAEFLESSKDYEKFAEKFAKELTAKGMRQQRGIWRKYYEAAKKLHYIGLPSTYTSFEYQVASNAVKQNFNMIKTIPKYTLELLTHKYTSTLIEEVMKGRLSRGSFRKLLEKHGSTHAKLIARTETAKLQTAILENRSTDLGSVAYIWRSSNDRRTRQSHRAMNDVVVFWKDQSHKPLLDNMRGNAGEFPNCRCTPLPIFDEDDLKNSSYKVYNYNTDQLETMSKRQVVMALEAGSL